MGTKITFLLDTGSVGTFLMGIFTGHNIALVLGGVASLVAIINHTDQWLERRKKRKTKNK